MEIRIEGDAVLLQMTQDEAVRLGVALIAGYETTSRPEYYIRTGLAQPVIREIARALIAAESGAIALAAGNEEIENPRRPRPRG